MAKTKISEFSSTPASNTDIDGINIAEGCAPSGINDAIRDLMAQLKNWQSGTSNDPMVIGSSGSLTLNQGTANGVTYLNGSKVVTSGSALTFDGTNFGIAGGTNGFKFGTASNFGIITLNGSITTSSSMGMFGGATGDADLYFQNATGGGYKFRVGTNTQATLDSSGNLGLGVTPSAWVSGDTVLQVKSGSSITSLWGRNASGRLISNAYYDGTNYKYYATASATAFETNVSGGFNWAIAPSGTAGTNVSFTQAMTLDASGNLGVGTTSPSQRLEVSGGDAKITAAGNGTRNLFFGTSSTNYQTIKYDDSTGALIIGSISSAYPVVFQTQGSERARIDSSGNLLVGTTSTDSGAKMRVSYGASANGIAIQDTNNTSGTNFVIFQNSTPSNIGSIARVTTTNAVVYNTTSDYRLKTVIGTVTGQGARIDALKPIDYQWKDGGQNARGFLAHEFKTVYPNSVTGDQDAVDEDGNPIYQAMQASTPEVIADLVAEIQSLRKRLADAGIA